MRSCARQYPYLSPARLMRPEGRFAICLAVCLILCLWGMGRLYSRMKINYDVMITYQSEDTSLVEFIQSNPIHLFSVISGTQALNQAVTMLKSILYYQGRLSEDSSACPLTVNLPAGVMCPSVEVLGQKPLVLHWVVSESIRNETFSLFVDWELDNVQVRMYDFEQYVQYVSHVSTTHHAGVSPMIKLMVPDIVDESVDRVIVLDTDILFNSNIEDLWSKFELFKPNQAIGASCEQFKDCPYSCLTVDGQFPYVGANTGVMLLNLTELRRIHWLATWQTAMEEELARSGQLSNVDQSVTNLVLGRNPELYFKLPCEWNVQLLSEDGLRCCPVYWIDREPDQGECRSEYGIPHYTKMARAIHFNTESKPELADVDEEKPLGLLASGLDPATLYQLREQFTQTYYKFRAMSTECFV